MKILILLLTLFSSFAMAQGSGKEISGDRFPDIKVDKNYVLNPFIDANRLNIQSSGHGGDRSTSSPIQGPGSFVATSSGAGSTRFFLKPWEKRLIGQNCQAYIKYEGGGGSWELVIWDSVVGNLPGSAPIAASNGTSLSINYPCGDVTSTRQVRLVTSGASPDLKVDEVYYGIATNLGTSPNQSDWRPFTPHTTQGLGSSTYSFEWRRDGPDLLIRGNILASSPASSEFRFGFPSAGMVAKSTITASQPLGPAIIAGAASTYGRVPITSPGFNYFMVGTQSGSDPGSTPVNANSFMSSGNGYRFPVIRIPIEGWHATSQTVSIQCASDGSCKNEFAAEIAANGSVVYAENNFITSCAVTSTTNYLCTLKTDMFRNEINCSVQPIAAGATWDYYPQINDATSSTFGWVYKNTNTGATSVPMASMLKCRRTRGDIRPEVVVPIVIGSVTSNSTSALRIETAIVASNGTVSGETSDFINGNCTNAVPTVCTFNSGVWSSQPLCQITLGAAPSNADVPFISSFSSSSISFAHYRQGTGQVIAVQSILACIGQRP